MASKGDMIDFARGMFLEYCQLLELCNIQHDTFFKWWDRFKTYEDMRKANTFLKGGKGPTKTCLLVSLILLNQTWKKLSPSQWTILLAISDSSDNEVNSLRELITLVKQTWKQKPKPPRGNN